MKFSFVYSGCSAFYHPYNLEKMLPNVPVICVLLCATGQRLPQFELALTKTTQHIQERNLLARHPPKQLLLCALFSKKKKKSMPGLYFNTILPMLLESAARSYVICTC